MNFNLSNREAILYNYIYTHEMILSFIEVKSKIE